MSKKQPTLPVDDPQDAAILRAWRATPVPFIGDEAGEAIDGQAQGGSIDDHDQMRNGEPLTAEEKAAVEETIERAREEAAKTKERLKGRLAWRCP